MNAQRFYSHQLDSLMNAAPGGVLIEEILSKIDLDAADVDWKGHMVTCVTSVLRPLVYLRDKGEFNLTTQSFIEHLDLQKMEMLALSDSVESNKTFSLICKPLMAYLNSLPDKLTSLELRKERQGIIAMQLANSLS